MPLLALVAIAALGLGVSTLITGLRIWMNKENQKNLEKYQEALGRAIDARGGLLQVSRDYANGTLDGPLKELFDMMANPQYRALLDGASMDIKKALEDQGYFGNPDLQNLFDGPNLNILLDSINEQGDLFFTAIGYSDPAPHRTGTPGHGSPDRDTTVTVPGSPAIDDPTIDISTPGRILTTNDLAGNIVSSLGNSTAANPKQTFVNFVNWFNAGLPTTTANGRTVPDTPLIPSTAELNGIKYLFTETKPASGASYALKLQVPPGILPPTSTTWTNQQQADIDRFLNWLRTVNNINDLLWFPEVKTGNNLVSDIVTSAAPTTSTVPNPEYVEAVPPHDSTYTIPGDWVPGTQDYDGPDERSWKNNRGAQYSYPYQYKIHPKAGTPQGAVTKRMVPTHVGKDIIGFDPETGERTKYPGWHPPKLYGDAPSQAGQQAYGFDAMHPELGFYENYLGVPMPAYTVPYIKEKDDVPEEPPPPPKWEDVLRDKYWATHKINGIPYTQNIDNSVETIGVGTNPMQNIPGLGSAIREYTKWLRIKPQNRLDNNGYPKNLSPNTVQILFGDFLSNNNTTNQKASNRIMGTGSNYYPVLSSSPGNTWSDIKNTIGTQNFSNLMNSIQNPDFTDHIGTNGGSLQRNDNPLMEIGDNRGTEDSTAVDGPKLVRTSAANNANYKLNPPSTATRSPYAPNPSPKVIDLRDSINKVIYEANMSRVSPKSIDEYAMPEVEVRPDRTRVDTKIPVSMENEQYQFVQYDKNRTWAIDRDTGEMALIDNKTGEVLEVR